MKLLKYAGLFALAFPISALIISLTDQAMFYALGWPASTVGEILTAAYWFASGAVVGTAIASKEAA